MSNEKKEKSMGRLYLENLGSVIRWLVALFLLFGVLTWLAGKDSVRTRGFSVLAAVGIMLIIIVPLDSAAAERKLREVERGWKETGKEHLEMQDKLRGTNRFIKEFVRPRDVLEHMELLRDEYRGRVTHALIVVRDLPATERNSASKLQDAIQTLGRTRDEVSRGEQALRDACTLATEHGFKVSPLEHYLDQPLPSGTDGMVIT